MQSTESIWQKVGGSINTIVGSIFGGPAREHEATQQQRRREHEATQQQRREEHEAKENELDRKQQSAAFETVVAYSHQRDEKIGKNKNYLLMIAALGIMGGIISLLHRGESKSGTLLIIVGGILAIYAGRQTPPTLSRSQFPSLPGSSPIPLEAPGRNSFLPLPAPNNNQQMVIVEDSGNELVRRPGRSASDNTRPRYNVVDPDEAMAVTSPRPQSF